MATFELKRIDNKIKALVSSAIFDVFNDPDFGLELSIKAKKRLSSFKTGKTFSLGEIKKKYF